MKKRKRNVKQTRGKRDHLSELPDSLILSILGLLPIRDVVRTTILSKRWESLWTTVSCLNFDDTMRAGLVERALKSWRGVKILKFKIKYYPSKDRPITSKDVDSWVRFAMDHQVQELSIGALVMCHGDWRRLQEYCVPQDLYSCSLLKELSLHLCRFDLKGDVRVQWNQLKSLSIHGSTLDAKTISRILCGSPQMEIFHLWVNQREDNLIIGSSRLKRLSIEARPCHVDGSPELALVAVKKELLGSPFPNVKLLQLNVGYIDYIDFVGFEAVVDAVEMLSEVKTLVLKSRVTEYSRARSSLNVERDLPKSFLLQLRTVEVTWTDGDDSMFPLIEFVLKYASKLEKMVFRKESGIRIKTPRKSLFLELQRLLRMPRSSPNAELIFCEY